MKKAIVLVVLLFPFMVFADNSRLDHLDIERMLSDRSFIFTAEYIQASKGANENIYYNHNLVVDHNVVEADLPYHTPDMDDMDNALMMFSTSDFTYTIEEKGMNWMVSIKPKGFDHLDLDMLVTPSGNAKLVVHHNNQEPVTYTGYLKYPH